MNISLSSIKTLVIQILHRFHAIIFVVIVIGGMIAVILLLNDIVTGSSQQATQATGINTGFDKATIDRINKLRTKDDAATQLNLSDGRTNPFVE